ncbi:SDR family NAD(P)-dependent oxidoreductase [Psychromonas antarctica]|uniref:SDR family NAD(P)-dependent oxidoreductase n=1 Tax=Psychromonas antarctica TaxID=67573 RepID=UPI001EE91C6C|nr:SDR family NAD(P)-dependent oxidoreductase [Psychromonas antarctica]MCG6202582.1 SDR family NAD(P)-dependent oxidoreductase [Psychromonas antarctica]
MEKVVLITGASAGLGEEFARQLAQKGFSLLLVARREERLFTLQQQLCLQYPDLVIHSFCVDLRDDLAGQQIIDYLQSNALSLVGLINNAGFGQRGLFSEIDVNTHLDMLQVNIRSLVALTYLAIAEFEVELSFIVNVASTAAFQAGPNLAVYYASKAFVLSFSEALHEELKEKQIQVSALCPGATNTEFAQVADLSGSLLFRLRVMEKQAVVDYALANLHKAIVIPGGVNKFGALMAQLSPRSITRKLAYYIQK